MQPIPLPAPYSGVDKDTPIIALQSPFCENLLNFNVTPAGVELRKEDSVFSKLTAGGAAGSSPMTFAPYGETALFLITYEVTGAKIDIYNVETAAVVYSTAALGIATFYPLVFNNYLFLFTPTTYGPGVSWNGAAWAAIGYTGASFAPVGGNVFKSRAYIIQNASMSYWYTGISQVTGALTAANDAGQVDLSSIVKEKSVLSSIASFTLSENISSVVIQSFIFSSGEILFYSGSYPNSSDWSLVGQARIPQLFTSGDSAIIVYQGDSLVLCDGGVVSLRDLFLTGSSEGSNLILNTRIEPVWKDFINKARIDLNTPIGPLYSSPALGATRGIWDKKNARLVISFPFYVDSAGTVNGSWYFVFNTSLKSWFFHQSAGPDVAMRDITFYNNKVLLSYSNTSFTMVAEKEGGTGFVDVDANGNANKSYSYEITSAPVSQGRAYVQRGAGLDVILETDLYAETNYQFIQDFGVTTTTAQTLPTGPTTLQKPFVNMGIEGSYIQYKISGTTTTGKTVGYNLYGVNFWVDAGDSPR